jgi:hypothetical protein
MSMLQQPPPAVPAPPPSEAEILSRKKWNWLVGVGGVSVISVLVIGSIPLTVRSAKKTDQVEAVNNARQIGLALSEFQEEYGSYPDVTTIAKVRAKTSSDLNLGRTSSNDFFRQLIASKIIEAEQVFYAKIEGIRKPDHSIGKGEALEKGECGFSFLVGLNCAGNLSRPLVVTPLIPGTDRFDPKKFDEKAVVLSMDNSVTSLQIDKNGHALLDGRNMLDPHHPIWDGHPPVIAWPE